MAKKPVYTWIRPEVTITYLPNGAAYQADDTGTLVGRYDASGSWIAGVDPADVPLLVAAGYAPTQP